MWWITLVLACGWSEREAVDVAPLMLRNQVHATKLWLAGTARNGPLASFYAEELEETARDLAAGQLVEEGVDLTARVRDSYVPALERVGRDIEVADWSAFEADYDLLVSQCNGCHQATRHGFVVIQRPTTNPFPNQRFTP